MNRKLPKRLPSFLHRYFWEIDANQPISGQDDLYVISRLLNQGNLAAIRWVRQHFSTSRIKKALTSRRGWDRRAACFWGNYYHVPEEKIKCLQPSYQKKQKSFWPY